MVSGNALQAWKETMWGQKEFNFEYIDIKGGFKNVGINRKKSDKMYLGERYGLELVVSVWRTAVGFAER